MKKKKLIPALLVLILVGAALLLHRCEHDLMLERVNDIQDNCCCE